MRGHNQSAAKMGILHLAKSVILLIISVILFVALPGCSGGEMQYQLLLRGHTSGYKVLKQWVGRGDKTTEDFTVNYDHWVIYSSNNPDSSNWQDGKGLLQITLYNLGTGKSQEIWNSYRPNEQQYQWYEKGTFRLEIKSTNTRWIVRVQVKADSDIVLKVNAGLNTGQRWIDGLTEGVPLGSKWFISGTLRNESTPMIGKTIKLYQEQNGALHQIEITQTYDSPDSTQKGAFSFIMQPLEKAGEYIYRVDYDAPDEVVGTFSVDLKVKAAGALYINLDSPEEGRVGEQVNINVELKDYLDQKPVFGAPINLVFCKHDQTNWIAWNTNLVTDASGQVTFDPGKISELAFPDLGEWQIKALFPGGQYNGIDYKAVETSPKDIVYKKGTPAVNLYLSNPPAVSFAPFKLDCKITNLEEQTISGNVTLILDATKNGSGLPLPLGLYSNQNTESINFPLSLESGSYQFWVEFTGNAYYEAANSNTLQVRFGQ